MKPEAIWDIESGRESSPAPTSPARSSATAMLLERIRKFQEKYDFLVCAVNQVPPFDATLDWPKSIEGVAMDNYVSWMKSAYWISATRRPGDLGSGRVHGRGPAGRHPDRRPRSR